jgi:flagellar basal-body rod modification protein FlgD
MATDFMAGISTTPTNGVEVGNTGVNPGANLDKDAFMKLLLTELQFQDPTDPMDSDKMLTQTSQLATLETQENTNKMMEKLANQMGNSMNMYALSAIGKMASIGTNSVMLEENGGVGFEIFFPSEVKTGELIIRDSNENIVRKVSLEEGSQGILAFDWDGTNEDGDRLPEGRYAITAEYHNTDNVYQATQFGVYPVESVRMEDGNALIKLGSSYVPLEYVKEFY